MKPPRQSLALLTVVTLLFASCAAYTVASPPPAKDALMPPPPTPEEVTVHGGMYTVKQIAFAPDGQTLAACTRTWDGGEGKDEEVVKLYDLATLHERLRFRSAEDFPDRRNPGHWYTNRVHALAYAPAGQTFATGDDTEVSLWDAQTGRHRTNLVTKDVVLALAFAPGGKELAASFTLPDPWVYDLATGHQRLTLRGDGINKIGYTYRIYALAYSPDGKMIATASGDRAVRLYDAADGRKLWTAATPGPVYSVAFAPDGKTIAAGTDASTATTSDCAVRLLDAATGRERAALMLHPTQVCALAFTPDGKSLISLGRRSGVVLWDVAAGKERAIFGRPLLRPECMALSPDGKTVALGGFHGDHRGGVITLLEIDGDSFHLRKAKP